MSRHTQPFLELKYVSISTIFGGLIGLFSAVAYRNDILQSVVWCGAIGFAFMLVMIILVNLPIFKRK